MKSKADEPSSALALVVHFPLQRRFKALVTDVNLTSPEVRGVGLSGVSGKEGKSDFVLVFERHQRRSCVFNLQDNLVSAWFSLLDCSLMSFLCLIN